MKFRDWRAVSDLGVTVPVISTLMESGVITFVVQLVQTLMYKFYITLHTLGGLVVRLYVRGFTVNC